jgi:hypothetical protein
MSETARVEEFVALIKQAREFGAIKSVKLGAYDLEVEFAELSVKQSKLSYFGGAGAISAHADKLYTSSLGNTSTNGTITCSATKPDILDKLQADAEAKKAEPEMFDGMELDKLFASTDD